MKRILTTIVFIALASMVSGQNLSLSFTSSSDAKFTVYLNGKAQNSTPSGMVTIDKLEAKEYHIRIVIDDPYPVAVTRRIKPNGKNDEYTVTFNPVKERVYLKKTKVKDNEETWVDDTVDNDVPEATLDSGDSDVPPHRHSIRPDSNQDSSTTRIVNKVRTNTTSDQ